MEVEATYFNFRMSPQKMREMVRQIQGLPALQAKAVLAVVPRKSARIVAKTLSSAMANAEALRSEWGKSALEQKASDLEASLEHTRNRKKKNRQKRDLAKYKSFLDSENRLSAESLWVKEAVAGAAPTYKRMQPKARGQGGPILKRGCNIRIVLSDSPNNQGS
jgi:large subunit ribosomal protein L22